MLLSIEKLAAALTWPVEELQALREEGLPEVAAGEFDPRHVADWLEARGLIEREFDPPVVDTVSRVAQAFGVRRDVVQKEWIPRGMPGSPGEYDLAAIAAWKRERKRDPARQAVNRVASRSASGSRQEKEIERLELDNESRRMRNLREAGTLIPREEPIRVVEKALLVITTQMEQLSERIAAVLPDLSGEDLERVQRELATEIDTIRHTAADCLEQLETVGLDRARPSRSDA